MKGIIFSALLIALTVMILWHSEDSAAKSSKKTAAQAKEKSLIEKQVDSLAANYDSSFFRAIYSLEDFKPNSVVSLEKTSRMYGSKWLSPESVLPKLSDKDKDTLIKSTADYLRSLDNETYRRNIIQKLKYWCMADQQFNFMNIKLGVFKASLIKAISNVPASQSLLSKFMTGQSKGKTKITETDREQAYATALNYISGLSLPEQYKYFSEVFNQLSLITSK